MEKQSNPIIIEFFSGTKTVSGVFENYGWDSVTVDNNQVLSPSICCDILDLDLSVLPSNPSFLWFSPVCQAFSRAASQSHWQKETISYRNYNHRPVTELAFRSLLMLAKCVQIINHYPGVPFVVENPVGRLHHTATMRQLGHYRYFVNYADFGAGYSKETYLFTNVWLPFNTKKYKVSAPGLRSVHSRIERSRVPALLAEMIYLYLFNGTT